MKKVMHFLPNLNNGGIESMLLNYYEYLNEDFKFDVIVHNHPVENCQEKFEKLGSQVFEIDHWSDRFFRSGKQLYRILKEEKPDIFHTHHNLFNFYPCFIAWLAKVPVRISHCHCYMEKKSFKQKIYSWLSRVFATDNAACGRAAAMYLTSEKDVQKGKVKIIHNAIHFEKFRYQEKVREKIRQKYGWNDKTVYGNVGRFARQKNQLFLIDIFSEIANKDNNARFVIIGGDGDLYEPIMEKIKNSNIKDKVLVLKNIQNVNEFYQAMDVFVLPSLFEGLAVSVVEAQISNLTCVVSSTITKEFPSDSVYYVPSLTDVTCWIKTLDDIMIIDRNQKVSEELALDYDITKAYLDLKNYYLRLLEKRK